MFTACFGILSIYKDKIMRFVVIFLNTLIETDELLRYIECNSSNVLF